jgi:hypothetical protein
VAAVALGSGALLLTHYWAAHLLAVAALVAVAGLRRDRRAAGRVLAGLAAGGVLFLPWLPSLLVQLAHTGTPWADAGGLTSLSVALTAWQGGRGVAAVLLGHGLVCLAVLALVAVRDPGPPPVLRLGRVRSPLPWALLALSAGTLVVGGLVSLATGSAVSARYTSVALPAFLALAAAGVAALPGRRVPAVLLAAVVLLGLVPAAVAAAEPRSQAGEVAAALDEGAGPGDVVAFCPDQLGPSVSRLAPAGLDLVVYPDLRPADRVDWTDYAQRNEAGDPAATAVALDARAGEHAVWVVTGDGFRVPSDDDCRALREELAGLRGEPAQPVQRRPGLWENMRLHRFDG